MIINGQWESTENIEGDAGSISELKDKEFLDRARAYANRLDATASAHPLGHAFVNGKHFDLDDVSIRARFVVCFTS